MRLNHCFDTERSHHQRMASDSHGRRWSTKNYHTILTAEWKKLVTHLWRRTWIWANEKAKIFATSERHILDIMEEELSALSDEQVKMEETWFYPAAGRRHHPSVEGKQKKTPLAPGKNCQNYPRPWWSHKKHPSLGWRKHYHPTNPTCCAACKKWMTLWYVICRECKE